MNLTFDNLLFKGTVINIPFVEFFILFSKQGLEQVWGFQTVDEACFTVVFPILYGWVSMFNFVNASTVALNSYLTTLWRSCHLLSQTWWVFILLSFHGGCFRFHAINGMLLSNWSLYVQIMRSIAFSCNPNSTGYKWAQCKEQTLLSAACFYFCVFIGSLNICVGYDWSWSKP